MDFGDAGDPAGGAPQVAAYQSRRVFDTTYFDLEETCE
jgi:hypothetical protein